MFRVVKQDAENADGEPEKEILIIKSKREAKADERRCFAKRESHYHAVLHEFRLLLGRSTFYESLLERKRKKK